MDATAYSGAVIDFINHSQISGMASEFGVRGYPTIKLLKGELAYNYKGPRTKDDVIEFANRVAGPAVRSLPSRQMFEHVLKRHSVLFLYVGGESPLKEKYTEVASELIVYTYFFSASEDVLPESVTLHELPSVLVFKDGTYFTYDEYEDGSLSSWVNRERFQSYLPIDGFTLYELGETGKLVAIAVTDEKDLTEQSSRLKGLIQRVAAEHRDQFNRDFQFGHMDGNDYINSLIMGEVSVPSIIILNTSNEQYFLPAEPVEDLQQLLQFFSSVLDGSAPAYGGDGFLQRIKRVAYDARSTVMSVFRSSPLLGCFLFGLPLGVISLMCYGICTAESEDDTELMKRDGFTDEEEDEGEEEEQQRLTAGAEDTGEEDEDAEKINQKSPSEKKMDMIWAQQQSESTDISRKHAVPQLVLFYFRVLLLSHTHVLLKLKRRRDGAMFRILQEVDGDQRKHHDESEPIGSNVFCASLY
ncbi:hypothetical protein cypCar_00024829, partial [Cyprinus carpio]